MTQAYCTSSLGEFRCIYIYFLLNFYVRSIKCIHGRVRVSKINDHINQIILVIHIKIDLIVACTVWNV